MTDSFEAVGDLLPAQSIDHCEPAEAVLAPAPATLNGFELLGLAPELLAAVRDMGYTDPTVVQVKTVPLALQAKGEGFTDLMVSSQTGSGKTAAFLLPVLHTLLQQQAQAQAQQRADHERAVAEAAAAGKPAPKRPVRKDPTNPRHFKAAAPGALVLCPTRELAQQVAHDAIDLVKHCRGLRIANVVGGMPYQMQIAKLQNANLVVATPGRLLDLQRSGQIQLDQVQFLVVDEADRMLDLGFSDDLAEINQLTAARRQTMMFSATFAPRIQQLAARVMREPQRITIDNPQVAHVNIKQKLFWADSMHHKRKLLDHWLRDASIAQAIVFASTQVECDALANDLQQDGFSAVALHGALSQGLRNRRLMALRNGQVQILVATDVAARGIDVPSISHVFNYGLPMKAEDYTHRIGRTGRAGRDGLAVTFAEMRDRRRIHDIEAYTRQPFHAEVLPGLEPRMRIPESRPAGRFDRGAPFERGPGAGGRGGFRGNDRGGNGYQPRGPIPTGPRHYAPQPGGHHAHPHHSPARGEPHFAARDAGNHHGHGGQRAAYGERFDRNGGGNNTGFAAPRGKPGFGGSKPAGAPRGGKPAFAKKSFR